MCWASSSTISASRAGSSLRSASRFLISSLHSGIFQSCDSVYRPDEGLPAAALSGQYLLPLGRQSVIAPPPLARFFDPAALNPAALFQPVEKRVKRGDVKLQHAFRTRFDQLADLVT